LIFNRNIINNLKNSINLHNKKDGNNNLKLIIIAILTIVFSFFYVYENCIENAITIEDLKRPDYSEVEKELDMQVSVQGKKFNTNRLVNQVISKYSKRNFCYFFRDFKNT